MANRIRDAIQEIQPRIDALDQDKRDGLNEAMAIEFDEHFAYQECQARSHAMGTLTADEAMVVYTALGEVGSSKNGGWAAGTDLATKVTVTRLMGELLKASLSR